MIKSLWLMTAADFGDRDCHDALRGLEWNCKGSFKRIDLGVRLEGWLSIDKVPLTDGYEEQVVWKWRVKDASLRAICGLAVSTIVQENLHARVGECTREGCDNIFLDRTSRGIRRQYCLQDECNKKRNIERVKKARDQSAKKKARGKKK